jgi:replication factor A1
MFSIDDIVRKICEVSGVAEAEARRLISEKQEELSGLVSEEGAAYIVARERGINLLKESKKQLRIGNLVDGLRSVDIVGKVVRVSPVREFERNGEKGRVANLTIGDETGLVRLSLWNDEVDLLEKECITENTVLRVSKGYVKMDSQGGFELRIGKGRLDKVDEEVGLPASRDLRQGFSAARRKPIGEFREGEFNEARASVLQLFRRNPFFEVCPKCGTRVSQAPDGAWVCSEHSKVDPDFSMVISGVIDDGTGNIRAVFFRELAEKLVGSSARELRKSADPVAAVFDGFQGLGKDFIFRGRVKLNALTESREMIVNDILEVDVLKEARDMLCGLQKD